VPPGIAPTGIVKFVTVGIPLGIVGNWPFSKSLFEGPIPAGSTEGVTGVKPEPEEFKVISLYHNKKYYQRFHNL
jgi:hypothetical protein